MTELKFRCDKLNSKRKLELHTEISSGACPLRCCCEIIQIFIQIANKNSLLGIQIFLQIGNKTHC